MSKEAHGIIHQDSTHGCVFSDSKWAFSGAARTSYRDPALSRDRFWFQSSSQEKLSDTISSFHALLQHDIMAPTAPTYCHYVSLGGGHCIYCSLYTCEPTWDNNSTRNNLLKVSPYAGGQMDDVVPELTKWSVKSSEKKRRCNVSQVNKELWMGEDVTIYQHLWSSPMNTLHMFYFILTKTSV